MLLYPFLFLCYLLHQDTTDNSLPVKGYSLTWSDEFDNAVASQKKWNHRALGKRDDAYIMKDAVKLDGKGNLIIEVSRRNDSVLTGMISTENIFETTYGYFECRVRFTHTPGTFPSFWLQSRTINEPNSTP
ncbi:MAG: glycoside hydrolase family 16 protein, partial [Chitinophagaceae bacterium]